MKRLLSIAAVLACAGLFGAAFYISETQAIVQQGLADLGFEQLPPDGGVIGAPSHFKIKPDTIKHLRSLMKEGKTLRVSADGRITIEPDADTGASEEAKAGE